MTVRKTTEQFIQEAVLIHGNKYDYSQSVYTGTAKKILIKCPKHGTFEQTPNIHLTKKSGCRKCKYESLSTQHAATKDEFIRQAVAVHGNKYDYSQIDYKNTHEKVCIICPVHGKFYQRPNGHTVGKNGCSKCGRIITAAKQAVTPTDFFDRCKIVHDNSYTYDERTYENMSSRIRIFCPVHGAFVQKANNHLNMRQRCPKCKHRVSRMEERWLTDCGLPNDDQHRQVYMTLGGKRFYVDGFDRITNTVYEFLGDYWHGNPVVFDREDVNPSVNRTYGWLYDNTMAKILALESAGFTVVVMWETSHPTR